MGVEHRADSISVVIADDHALVRAGFDALLTACDGIRIVGHAADGAELLALLHRQGAPDVIVLDLSMPNMDGLRSASEIRARFPAARILIVTMLDDPLVVRDACDHGVHGFIVKDAAPQELEQAVRALGAGGSYFSGHAMRCLLAKDPLPASEELTQRQIEVLVLLARGCSSREVAHELGLSPKTVDVHRHHIMERLDIRDLAGLTRYAIRHGLLEP